VKILRCYYTHFIFITHIVHCSSIFLSSYVNFCMLTHKFSHRCTHCHHAHFIFTIKQFIFASSITRMVAKNILHAHYVAKLRTFLLGITIFLSITNSPSAFFIVASQCVIIFVTYMLSTYHSSSQKIIFSHSYTSIIFCIQNYNYICTIRRSKWAKINILLTDNY